MNDLTNPNNAINLATNRYQITLNCLDNPKIKLSAQQVLEILAARDELQRALKDEQSIPPDLLSQIYDLDAKLKGKADKINRAIALAEYRESLPEPPQDWWWQLDSKNANLLLKGLAVLTWTGSLGLLANIASRFLSGGVGVVGAAAIFFPSFLTMLQARSELTEAGQHRFENILVQLGVPHQYREPIKFLTLLMLFGFLLGFWFLIPTISEIYNQQGLRSAKNGNLGTAQENYQRAIALDPDNVSAHYNLGNLYEDLQEFDKAKTEYLIAVQGNVPEAYNNLGRLFIQQKKYPEAVSLIQQGLLLAGKTEGPTEVKYNLFKNLGWARFEQNRDLEAWQALQVATGIAKNPEIAPYIANPGSSYCLLAQVLDRQKRPAIAEWQKCNELGSTLNPDEDTWLNLSYQKLQEVKP
jgi:tetratricopeptide (TPR) repeat protein